MRAPEMTAPRHSIGCAGCDYSGCRVDQLSGPGADQAALAALALNPAFSSMVRSSAASFFS